MATPKTSYLKAPKSWKDPAAKRFITMLEQCIQDGRSFSFTVTGDSVTVTIGGRK